MSPFLKKFSAGSDAHWRKFRVFCKNGIFDDFCENRQNWNFDIKILKIYVKFLVKALLIKIAKITQKSHFSKNAIFNIF